MSHVPHDLAEEFPAFVEQIHALKQSDAHFARLAEAYHALNRQVHRAETNVEPMDGFAETALRKERAAIKDQIWGMLSASK